MRKVVFFVTMLALATGSALAADVAPDKDHPFGDWCWVKGEQSIPARMDDEKGHMKTPTSSFSPGKPLRVSDVDGKLLVNGVKVWVGGFYVRPGEVVFDPRLSYRWECQRLNGEGGSLWERVADMAGSQDFDSLTDKIVRDIANSGVIPGVKSATDLGPPKDVAKRMTREQINEILLRYSQLAWKDHPFAQ